MDSIEQYEFPISLDDLRLITQKLRERPIFVPSFSSDGDDIYDPVLYRRQELWHNTNTLLLPDRNIVSCWIASLNGCKAEEDHRLCAAIIAFAQCANIIIEPNIALYEYAATGGNEMANGELRRFRIADNLPTKYWAALATKNVESLPVSELECPAQENDSEIDFNMPLRKWRRNYILALKIAELELLGGRSDERMAEMLRWMFEDFLIGAAATILAAHYLAPDQPRKGLLKNLRSDNREKAIAGVKNAAWDLTLLSDYLKRIEHQKEANKPVLLASLDNALLRIARELVDKEATNETTVQKIAKLWPSGAGKRLGQLLANYSNNRQDSRRQVNQQVAPQFIDNMISMGEERIRLPIGK